MEFDVTLLAIEYGKYYEKDYKNLEKNKFHPLKPGDHDRLFELCCND